MYRGVFLCLMYLFIVNVCPQSTSTDTTATATDNKCSTDNINTPETPRTVSVSGLFRGVWWESRRGRRFQAYRGIRYAEPPVGELRFKPPVSVLKYEDEVDASEEGPACPMFTRPGYYVDENCLRLNVYTPAHNASCKLPVVVYIHPGGFYSMSGRSDLAGPHYLMDRNLVLVTINYRIGTLGFLSLGTELAPGNNGFKDQTAALRWVQRNVAAFGGDPRRVTLAGCSAGSLSVMCHMLSPMSKGLFHRAIAVSGSPMSKVPLPNNRLELAVRQAQILGCPTDNTTALFYCLKAKPWTDYTRSIKAFFEFGLDPLTLWRPVVELDYGQERFLAEEPMETVRHGRFHAVPIIISQSTGEFFWKAFTVLNNDTLLNMMNEEWDRIAPISFILPRQNATRQVHTLRREYLGGPVTNDTRGALGLGHLYGDAITGFPVHRMANLMCRHSPQPVYYANFAYIGNHSHYEDPISGKPTGVAHQDDLLYLFTLSYRFPSIPLSSPDSFMVDRMTAIWYNFARHGDPNPRGDLPELSSLSWPRMEPRERRYLRISDHFSVRSKMFEDRFRVWDELYPIQY